VFNVSIDIKELQKCYKIRRLPAVVVKEILEKIDNNGYTVREEGDLIVTYFKHANNVVCSVDCSSGCCSCRHFIKMGYCKHLLHAHALLNEDTLTTSL
jgi:hypothetical protein